MKLFQMFILFFLNRTLASNNSFCIESKKKSQLSDQKIIEIPLNNHVMIQSRCNKSNLSSIDEGSNKPRNMSVWLSANLDLCTTKAIGLTSTCTHKCYSGLIIDVIYVNINVNYRPNNLNCWIRRRKFYDAKLLGCTFNKSDGINITMENDITGSYKSMVKNPNNSWFYYNIPKFNPFHRFIFRVETLNDSAIHCIVFEANQIVALQDDQKKLENLSIQVINSTPNMVKVLWSLQDMYNMYEFSHIIQLTGSSLEGIIPGRLTTRNTTDEIQFELDIHLEFAGVYNLTVYTCVKDALNWTAQHTRAFTKFENQKSDTVENESPQAMPEVFDVYVNDVIFYFKPTASNYSENVSIVLREMWKNGQLNIISDLNYNKTSSDLLFILNHLKPNSTYGLRLEEENMLPIFQYERLLDPPQNLYLVQNESLYILSWTTNEQIDNFTVFWCTALKAQKLKCQDNLKAFNVTGNGTNHVYNNSINGLIGSPKNFAISSTSNNQTSSMKWFTCTTSTKIPMAPIDKVAISRINSTAVKLSWDLPCERSPFVKAINITYCKSSDDICDDGFSHTVNLPSEVIIDGLELTNYTFKLSMFDGVKFGPTAQAVFDLTSPGSSILYECLGLALTMVGILSLVIKFGIQRYKIIKDIHASIPSGLDTFEPSNLTRKDIIYIINKQKCVRRSDNDDVMSKDLNDSEILQTITFEELEKELEIENSIDYTIETCANIMLNGNYVQVHQQQQNVGYVRIADLK